MAERKTARDLLGATGKIDRDVVGVVFRGRTFDLHTPLEGASSEADLTPVRTSDPRGLAVIRHSTAHVMADAVQRLFPGTKVTIGPAIDEGFYYDFDKPGGGTFSDDDLGKIERTMLDIIKRDTPFVREVVTRD